MECDVCKGKKEPVFPCDGCKTAHCKTCAGLTSSEIKVMQLKDRLMIFYCKKCKDGDTITLLQSLIADKSRIIAANDEIIQMLRKKVDELEANSAVVQKVVYSDAVKKNLLVKKPELNNTPALIIKSRHQQDPEKTKFDLIKKVNPSKLKIGIRAVRNTKKGDTIVRCQNIGDLESLKNEIGKKMSGYDVQVSKLRKPRIKIVGYQGTLEKEEIEQRLRDQNKFIGEIDELRVTYVAKSKKSSQSIIFGECSSQLFHKFMAEEKVFLDWERCSVYEDISIRRCFKCQGYYHKQDSCTEKIACEYCSEDHKLADCQKAHKTCINCVRTNQKFKRNHDIHHTATDPDCPSLQYLMSTLRNRTDYGNQGS